MSVYLGDIDDVIDKDTTQSKIQNLFTKGEYKQAMFLAVKSNNFKALETIIIYYKVRNKTTAEKLVNSLDDKGWSPLMYASRYGFIEIATILVPNGADVNFKTIDIGITPLIIACLFNQLNIETQDLRDFNKMFNDRHPQDDIDDEEDDEDEDDEF